MPAFPSKPGSILKAFSFFLAVFCCMVCGPARAEGPSHAPPCKLVASPHKHKKPHPMVAIIIDDLGLSLTVARSFLNVNIPLSFSILPRLAYSRKIAEMVHSRKMDVLFHIPMEPYKYPKIDPGPDSLLSSMNSMELTQALKEGLKSVPYAIGANNHMGSKLTEDERAMRVVLGCLKDMNIFFIDSVTTKRSIALKVAKEIGLKSARRKIFLDTREERSFIRGQFLKLKRAALRDGSSIGIGHPHRVTLSVLKEMLPEFKASGICFVSVSELVR